MKGPLAVRLPFKRVEIHLDAEHGMSRLQVYPIWTPPDPEGCQVPSLLRFDVEPPNQGAVALMILFGGLCQLLGATAVRG